MLRTARVRVRAEAVVFFRLTLEGLRGLSPARSVAAVAARSTGPDALGEGHRGSAWIAGHVLVVRQVERGVRINVLRVLGNPVQDGVVRTLVALGLSVRCVVVLLLLLLLLQVVEVPLITGRVLVILHVHRHAVRSPEDLSVA